MKDRAGAQHDSRGRAIGQLLTPDKILIDSTSGNTGIAYAMIGAARGYRVKLCLPQNASPERKRILKAYGAELVLTDRRRGLRRSDPQSPRDLRGRSGPLFLSRSVQQSDANWQAHFNTTGPEIIEQTDGRITHFVALLGTSGTFVGTARRLQAGRARTCECISAQPSTGFHGLEGTKHMPTAIVPAHLRRQRWPTAISGSKPKTPIGWCGVWRAKKGCWWGFRRAATCTPRCSWRRELHAQGEAGVIVTVLCDGADKYLSEHFWERLRMIRIEREPWREMVNHAQAAYPNECCGAMIGTIDGDNKTVALCAGARQRLRRVRRRARYELRPEDLLRADREARERKLDLIGIYHSHPDCDAYFSETDLKNSCPWYSFVVLSIQNGEFRPRQQLAAQRRTDPRRKRGTNMARILIPTPLRQFAEKQDTVEAARRHRGRSAGRADHALSRSEEASLHRRRQAAQLRECLSERRRHPLSEQRSDAGAGRATRSRSSPASRAARWHRCLLNRSRFRRTRSCATAAT